MPSTAWMSIAAPSGSPWSSASAPYSLSTTTSITTSQVANPSIRSGYGFPGNTAQKAPLQGPLAQLDGATQLTVIAWFKLTGGLGTYQALFTRYNDTFPGSDASDQWFAGVDVSNKLLALTYNAGLPSAIGSTVLSTVSEYKATFVYDGTQSAQANRTRMYLSVRSGDDTFSSDATETIALTGTWPAALPTPTAGTSALSAIIGGSMGAFNALNGQVDELRVWFGAALSYSSITNESINSAPVTTPSLRYTFEPPSSTSNIGSVSGFTVQPTSLVTLVSIATSGTTQIAQGSVSTTTSIFALPAWTAPAGPQSAWVSA